MVHQSASQFAPSRHFLQPSKDERARLFEAEVGLRATFAKDPREGLEVLFCQHYTPLCRHAVQLVHSRQIAEDLVSEVFFQFYITQAYRRITTSYRSYLFRSVHNEASSYLHRNTDRTLPLDTTSENQPDTQQLGPDAEVQYNHLLLTLNQTIARLPPQCQRVFQMSRFDNKTYHQIAHELGLSAKTVEAHIRRALRQLRRVLHSEGHLLSVFMIALYLS